MDNNVAIKLTDVSKMYKLYDSPTSRLKEALNFFGKRYHSEFDALKNISLEIKKGETVGIVGKNGSGKSTLLKIITGVLTPTQGSVIVNGKIAALLELGAGFNPEFTGLENIYLNGTIMGYSKKEIDVLLDEILAFADIGNFVYQPVKSYSSGMLVRLAFAVQVQVQPDILIVDEALAVGDALFQKRCFQKMEELISKGTTLLFVSHDQEIVRTMTNRAVLLSEGSIKAVGKSSDVLLEYRKILHEDEKKYFDHETKRMKSQTLPTQDKRTMMMVDREKQANSLNNSQVNEKLSFGDLDAEILSVSVLNIQGEESSCFFPGEAICIRVNCKINKDLKNLNIALRIRNKQGIKMYSWGTLNQDIAVWNGLASGDVFWDREFRAGENISVLFETFCTLGGNLYEVQAAITEEKDRYYGMQRMLHWRDEAAFFHVNMKFREYFFGGVCDLKMRVIADE